MYARITTTEGMYDRDVVVDYLASGVAPTFERIPGYRGISASCDPVKGTVWVLSTWDSLDAVRVTDEVAEHLRQIWLGTTHRQLRSVRVYEMEVETNASPGPAVGCTLQLLPFVISDKSAVDGALADLRDGLLPALASQPGFRAARQLVDRATGTGLIAATWGSVDAAQSGLDTTVEHRDRATARGVDFGEPAQHEIIFAHVLTRTP